MAQDEHAAHHSATPTQGALSGVRVIELADEQAEYCGLILAGLGADVIKVEPPGGSPTRRIGPFYQDQNDPERSLFFWQYNRGKRSIMLDLQQRHAPVRVHAQILGRARFTLHDVRLVPAVRNVQDVAHQLDLVAVAARSHAIDTMRNVQRDGLHGS